MPAVSPDPLEARLRTLLPPEYGELYETVEPKPMRSASLVYDPDGRVAWDRIWGSFCDLAMAGGPPHKGALLEPGFEREIDEAFDRYDEVAEEICRGIRAATGLRAYVSPDPGWVSVTCQGDTMAGWLLRAITMENVSVRRSGAILELPASPRFRLDREIKNVVTVVAKTAHYWLGHIPDDQKRAIAELFAAMACESPLVEPDSSNADPRAQEELRARIGDRVHRSTGLPPSALRYPGWLGLECPTVRTALWMMRVLVAGNVLSRREGLTLFVPIDAATDRGGAIVAGAVERTHRWTAERTLR